MTDIIFLYVIRKNASKIQSKTVINYVTAIKELLSGNPYKMLLNEIYQVKDVKREGWIRRKINITNKMVKAPA